MRFFKHYSKWRGCGPTGEGEEERDVLAGPRERVRVRAALG